MNEKKQGKKFTKSRTIRVGSFYVGVGILVAALQALGGLEEMLNQLNAENLDTSQATWIGIGLAAIGIIKIYLRTITKEPIE
jgi:Na+/H+ antiporter NhaD/arsenite permease-like protein